MHRSWGLPVAGAVAVAGLAWYTAVAAPPAIEQDLRLRTFAALRDAGIEIPPNGLQIHGQTATLSGPQGSPIVSEDAMRRVGAVWGVTEVNVLPWGGDAQQTAATPVPLPAPLRIPTAKPSPAQTPSANPNGNKLQQELSGHNIAFRGSTDVLLPESRRTLDQLARVIRAAPKAVAVEIAAHTDSDGDERKNLALSKRRASAVRRYLISRGVAQNRLKDEGYGQTKPIAPNDSDSNKARNRRVEFHVMVPDPGAK